MRAVLRFLAELFHITDVVVHWRLGICLVIGSAVACSLWALAPSRVLGAVLFLAAVGVAAGLGMIWERGKV